MLLARKALQLLLFMGSLISLLASGRFSVRLIVDGAISFAFVPVLCVVALAVVCRRRPRPGLPFARVVDRFFVGFTPWLFWIVIAGAVFACVPPRAFSPWFYPVLLAGAVPLGWSIWIDWQFFREVLEHSPRRALGDLVIHRAIEWVGTLAYFLGIAIWYDVLPGLCIKLGF